MFRRCVVHHHLVSYAFPKVVRPEGVDVYLLLNDLPEAATHVSYMIPVFVHKDQQLASVTALQVAFHVASAWQCTSFALMGGGALAAATCSRLYMATSLKML